MPRILGLDYGRKKIGLALSDPEGKIAFPKSVYPAKWPYIAEYLRDVIDKEDVGEIVIGLPLNLDGTENDISQEVVKFVENLKEYFKIPMHFESEVFTSAAVKTGGAAPSHKIDASAAALILQSYLDRMSAEK